MENPKMDFKDSIHVQMQVFQILSVRAGRNRSESIFS
jgi:hypothetical protein